MRATHMRAGRVTCHPSMRSSVKSTQSSKSQRSSSTASWTSRGSADEGRLGRLHSSSSRGRVLYRVRCRMEASGKTLSKELSALKTKSLGGSLFQSRQDGQPAPQLLETDVVVLPPLTPAGLGPLYSCVMALEWSVGRAFHRMKVVLPQPSTRSMQHGACRYAKCNLGWPFRALADNASQTACRHYRRVGTIILSTVCAGTAVGAQSAERRVAASVRTHMPKFMHRRTHTRSLMHACCTRAHKRMRSHARTHVHTRLSARRVHTHARTHAHMQYDAVRCSY